MGKELTVLILQGIPASGKSTFAREFIRDKSKEWVIVNRDSIREMLGKYWVPSREKLVTEIEDHMILDALEYNYNVIIDATNFNKNTLKRFKDMFIEYMDYTPGKTINIEYKKFEVDLQEAIERDKNRDRTVGEDIIRNFYFKYKYDEEN